MATRVEELCDVIDTVISDASLATEAKIKLFAAAKEGSLPILTAAEPESADFFRGGWRPFIGWVCGFGFLAQVVFAPVVVGISSIIGKPIVFPPLDVSVLLTMLGAATGMGVMRTTEKLKGIK